MDTENSSDSAVLEMLEVFGMTAESDLCLTVTNEGSENKAPFNCGVTKKGSRLGYFSVT